MKSILICFAVKEEHSALRIPHSALAKLLVTGMGRRNAERAIREALAKERPELVLTCGFAGGLKPGWQTGTVVFEVPSSRFQVPSLKASPVTLEASASEPASQAGGVEPATCNRELETRLSAAGAVPGRFCCAERVATTAREKQELRAKTGADVVEMESGVIGAVCQELGVPCATVRVVLDTAEEDLPLDFNALMTPDLRLDGRKLALVLAKAPWKVAALLRLQKQTKAAAKALGSVLEKVL